MGMPSDLELFNVVIVFVTSLLLVVILLYKLYNKYLNNTKSEDESINEIIDNDTLNVHTLRGTFIENSINNNRNENMIVPIVQEIVGHTKNDKESLTLDTYMKGQELELKLNIVNKVEYVDEK